jgi:hypothetical protein
MHADPWSYRSADELGTSPLDRHPDVSGFAVEALDGSIGKVDETRVDESDRSCLVVDTGPWIFGKKVMLPAGVVERIDAEAECVYVNRTKDEIKNAPELDDALGMDEAYHTRLGEYYGPGGVGFRAWD